MVTHTKEQKTIIESEARTACIFACAGSGKTYTLTHKIAHLVQSGGIPSSRIAAITFTNLATEHLRASLARALSNPVQAAEIYAGTIHSFCSSLLREVDAHLGRDFEVFTDAQQWVLFTENWSAWGLDRIANGMSRGNTIDKLTTTIAIAKMESVRDVDLHRLHPGLLEILNHYRAYCQEYARLDFSDLLVAVRNRFREDPSFRDQVLGLYDFIFIDEYQDVDPVQAEIVRYFAGTNSVWVVGDDDQSIYQFRGTDYRNILEFASAPICERHELTVNRRCKNNILSVAEEVAKKLEIREPKKMEALHKGGSVIKREFNTLGEEVNFIVSETKRLLASGKAENPGQIAILMRSVASYGSNYIDALRAAGIPVVVRGGKGLFDTPEVQAAWAALEWLVKPRDSSTVSDILLPVIAWDLSCPIKSLGDEHIKKWLKTKKLSIIEGIREKYSNRSYETLQELLFDVINALNLLSKEQTEAVHHNTAELTRVFDSYLSVNPTYHLSRVCGFLSTYASRASDESAPVNMIANSINVLTMHQAKGLEFRYVFIPMLVDKRFPLERQEKNWLIDDKLFNSARYYGTSDAERRLFYVALTRAEDCLYLTCARDVGLKREKLPSRYFTEVPERIDSSRKSGSSTKRPTSPSTDSYLVSSYSALEYYLTCPYRYKLLRVLKLSTPQNPFFKFGQVVHNVIGRITQTHLDTGRVLPMKEVLSLYDQQFDEMLRGRSLPPYVVQRTKKRGVTAIKNFCNNKSDWIRNTLAVEKDFNYADSTALIRGRMDLIVKGSDSSQVIVDVKTGRPQEYLRPDFQMKFYALAANRQLGMSVSNAILYYIEHDDAKDFKINRSFMDEAQEQFTSIVKGIFDENYEPTPGAMCTRCEVRGLCQYRKKRSDHESKI